MTSLTTEQKRHILLDVGRRLRDKVRDHPNCNAIQLKQSIGLGDVKPTDSDKKDDWYLCFGSFVMPNQPKKKVYTTVWLGQYGSTGEYRLWRGVAGVGGDMLDFIADIPQPYQSTVPLLRENIEQVDTRTMREEDLDKMVPELYGNRYWFGLFDQSLVSVTADYLAFISEAVNMFAGIVGPLSPGYEVDDFERDNPDAGFTAKENQTSYKSHLVRERNSRLARACKERDGYRCQVCSFFFPDLYGDLGHGFAEAHHIAWLGLSDEERDSSVDDLVTVCANCHRMLHRMKGAPDDVDQLRTIMAEHRGDK